MFKDKKCLLEYEGVVFSTHGEACVLSVLDLADPGFVILLTCQTKPFPD